MSVSVYQIVNSIQVLKSEIVDCIAFKLENIIISRSVVQDNVAMDTNDIKLWRSTITAPHCPMISMYCLVQAAARRLAVGVNLYKVNNL